MRTNQKKKNSIFFATSAHYIKALKEAFFNAQKALCNILNFFTSMNQQMRIYSLLCALVAPLGAMERSPRQINLSKLNDSALQKVGSGAPVVIQELAHDHSIVAVADSVDAVLHRGFDTDLGVAYSLNTLNEPDLAHWFCLAEGTRKIVLSPNGACVAMLLPKGYFVTNKTGLESLIKGENSGEYVDGVLSQISDIHWLSNTRFIGCGVNGIEIVDFPDEITAEKKPLVRYLVPNGQAEWPLSRFVPIAEDLFLWSRSGSSLFAFRMNNGCIDAMNPSDNPIPANAILATHQSGLIAWAARGSRAIELGCLTEEKHKISHSSRTAQEMVHAFVFSPCGKILAIATGPLGVNSLQIRGIVLPELKTYPIGKITFQEAPLLEAIKLWWPSHGEKTLIASGKSKKSAHNWLVTAKISPLAIVCAHEQYKRKQEAVNDNNKQEDA